MHDQSISPERQRQVLCQRTADLVKQLEIARKLCVALSALREPDDPMVASMHRTAHRHLFGILRELTELYLPTE